MPELYGPRDDGEPRLLDVKLHPAEGDLKVAIDAIGKMIASRMTSESPTAFPEAERLCVVVQELRRAVGSRVADLMGEEEEDEEGYGYNPRVPNPIRRRIRGPSSRARK